MVNTADTRYDAADRAVAKADLYRGNKARNIQLHQLLWVPTKLDSKAATSSVSSIDSQSVMP